MKQQKDENSMNQNKPQKIIKKKLAGVCYELDPGTILGPLESDLTRNTQTQKKQNQKYSSKEMELVKFILKN